MNRSTRNALLGLGGVATAGLVPLIYRWLNPRPKRRPRLSTELGDVAAPSRTAPLQLVEEEERWALDAERAA